MFIFEYTKKHTWKVSPPKIKMRLFEAKRLLFSIYPPPCAQIKWVLQILWKKTLYILILTGDSGTFNWIVFMVITYNPFIFSWHVATGLAGLGIDKNLEQTW